ncbi:MAG: helix-turn-helix domain-containing protein [Ruminococcus sp.]|nr:helix-turn-helix domain-containing protein [Ruminococcus sp.]
MKEPKAFRDHLAYLNEAYPGRTAFSAKELAGYLDLDPEVVSRLIREGKLPGRRVGRQYRTTFAQLARWECGAD